MIDDGKLLTAEEIGAMIGRSPATITRWARDSFQGFPQPIFREGVARQAWRAKDYLAWLDGRAAKARQEAEAKARRRKLGRRHHV